MNEATRRALAGRAVVGEADSPRLASAKKRLGDTLLYRSLSEDIPAEERPVTRQELADLERVLDALFAKADLDIEFTRHFFDRLNDPRNVRQITVGELARVFRAVWQEHGRRTIAKKPPDWEALIKDVTTKINIPFVLNYNRRTGDMELVAKTIMRKKNFLTRDPKLVVTSPQESLTVDTGATKLSEARPGQFFEPVGSRAPRKKLREMDVNELRAELLRLGEHYLVVMRLTSKPDLIARIEARRRERASAS